jgi:hypothetical protein
MIAGCRGTARIVQFNWPFYAMAAVLVPTAVAVASARPAGMVSLLLGGSTVAAFWMVASLGASWAVYDRSPLMAGRWVLEALPSWPQSWMVITAGFDEMTPALRRVLTASPGRTFDIYDPVVMTEPSIRRARRWADADAEPTDPRRLPVADHSVDAAILPLSAHELRTHRARCQLLAEVARTLASDGRVVVVEHLRNVANFLAFGPGVLHFHSRRAWCRCFDEAGLTIREEFPITPFVRVFVLTRPA